MPHGDWNTGRVLPPRLCRLLATQQGVLSMLQARQQLSRTAVRHLLANRRWQLVHGTVLVAHNGELTDQQRIWAASFAVGAGYPAPVGGRTALAAHGLRGFATDKLHILLPSRRRALAPPPLVVVHRARRLTVDDVHLLPLPCTTVARSVVDAASWAVSDDEARTVVAMAFQQRLTSLAAIEATVALLPRAKRRRLVLRTAADAAGGAHSLSELDAIALIRRAGLPEPSAQAVRTDATGRRRYLDLYWRRWNLHVEIDGAHHLDVRQAWLDADRQNQLWIAGDRVLRFPAWVIREQPQRFVDDLRRALVAAGWH